MNTMISVILIILLTLIGCHASEQQDSEAKWQYLKDSANVNINITQALINWRKDSTGCLSMRMDAMLKGLYKVVKLEHLTHEQVVELLGSPNMVRPDHDRFNEQEVKLEVLTYFTSSDCYEENGEKKVEMESWLDISIEQSSQRVVKVMGGVR